MHLEISSIDVAVLIAYLAGVTTLGLWLGRGQRNIADYLLGGRDLPWWGVLLSIVATETSTVTFLSVPGLAFDRQQGDLRFLQLPLGYVLGRIVVVFLFMPRYFRGEIYTAYQVLERRFGGTTKQAASLLFIVTRNLADGLRLYLAAIVLQKVLGLELPICIAVVGVTTIVYTVAGGMKSVVWNDCIQFVVYIVAAMVAGLVLVGSLPGGWSQLAEFARQHEKFRLFDLSFDPSRKFTLWSGVLGGMFLAMATHGTDQMMVQRYLAARSQRQAGRALILSGLVVFAQFALFLLIGVGLACFYDLYPPPTPFAQNDEVFAAFIVDHLPMGVVGITLAGVFASAMSALSGSLNSSATAALNDWYLPLCQKSAPQPATAHALLRLARALTVVFGLVQMGVAVAAWHFALANTVISGVLAIAGFASGTILGVFLLGTLTRRVAQRGSLIGLLGGLAGLSCLAWTTNLAWPWFAVVGSFLTFAIGLIASMVVPEPKEEIAVGEIA
jgi:solute:Na+ symporter, SSS family